MFTIFGKWNILFSLITIFATIMLVVWLKRISNKYALGRVVTTIDYMILTILAGWAIPFFSLLLTEISAK